MVSKSITRRWIINGLGLIFLIIFVIEIVFAIFIKSYYYDSVEQKINSQIEIIKSQLVKFSNSNSLDVSNQIRNMVEEFNEKDKMELMAIDASGEVSITSSGFNPHSNISMPDYHLCIESDNKMGKFIGKSDTGEKIMAICFLSPFASNQLNAIRFVVSLEKIDSQIFFLIMLIILIGLAVLLFVIISGSYFINSIVIPIGQISLTAKKIASGNFETSLEKKYNDEIGDLCDTINYMAEELKETENMKNDFISSVSHELRTPLTAIKGWGETILTQPETDKPMTEKGMKIILKETQRLADMVEELLDFSRMQNGNFNLISEKIDLIAELDEAIYMFTQRALQEGKTIYYTQTEKIAPVLGDKNRLRQVFINILDNALKYSSKDGVISVNTLFSSDQVQIKIKDTGCGISKDDITKVKLKFYKANNTVRGSGIGLAVADEIVKKHSGELLIESLEGVGTTVTICLPLIPNESTEYNI